MADASLTGGCQCGAVRFHATSPRDSAICHCRMCQKAFGNYFAPLVTVEKLEWTRGEPTFFRSSNLAERGFCAKCGTPLLYRGDNGSIEIAAGALDDPQAAAPRTQINIADRLALFDTLPDVPPYAHPDKEAAFNAGVVNFQHPDHDTAVWPPAGGFPT
jgi:hypothetical protein